MSSPRSQTEANPARGRRGARRLALQALYQWLMSGGDASALAAEFLSDRAAPGIDAVYFRELLDSCIEHADSLDAELAPLLETATAEIDPVEHAVLLIGAAELRDRRELAVSVIINEAVELAKSFGAENGHRFVNGVLDGLARRLRPAANG